MIKVPYALAVHGQEELEAVSKVIKEKRTIMGQEVQNFEKQVASLFDKKHGIMVNSGSSANFLAFETLNIEKGLEVITPILTFSTTLAPILQKGLVPVFTDAKKKTYQMDVDQVESLITNKTRAIMAPSLIGNVPDYPRLCSIAKERNLILIEDSADTLGSKIDGIPTGKYSHISTTSFYGSHIITAGGNGGMICVNSDEWANKIRRLRGWGRASAIDESESIDDRFRYRIDDFKYDSKFLFEEIGYNFLPNEMEAAFGCAQFKKLEKFIRIRKENFSDLVNFFSGYKSFFQIPETTKGVDTAWLAFPLRIRENSAFTRFDIVQFLEQNGIQTRPVFSGNIIKHPGFKKIASHISTREYPVADNIMKNSFLIGCHHGMGSQEVNYLKEQFETFLIDYE